MRVEPLAPRSFCQMERSLPQRTVYPRGWQPYSFTTASQLPQVLENEMKVLKIALIACALSAAVAHAQTEPAAAQQQVAQADVQRANGVSESSRRVEVPKTSAQACVGPMSFCNIYFGS
jgi:hypothetical protein